MGVRVVGLLAWWEESPVWLAATVASLGRVCDHVVAVDGAYAVAPYAHSHPTSGPEQAEAIIQAAHAAGIGCTVHVPTEAWRGNEVGKRAFLFDAGRLVAEPWDDWFLVVDSDEIVQQAPVDLHDRLAATNHHVGEVTIFGRTSTYDLQGHPDPGCARYENLGHRCLFRATPELTVEGNHATTVTTLDGTRVRLRGDSRGGPLEPAVICHDMMVEHRHGYRPGWRNQLAQDYYRVRDMLGLEEEVTSGVR